jgi:hypothetical protein
MVYVSATQNVAVKARLLLAVIALCAATKPLKCMFHAGMREKLRR